MLPNVPWRDLALPLTAAEDALARLDERLARSPIQEGWRSRTHFTDASAAIWLEGDLVLTEDLVLHDASRDTRSPTLEVVRAHSILRTRRRIAQQPASWAFSTEGLAVLRTDDATDTRLPAVTRGQGDEIEEADEDAEDALAAELAALDAALARTDRALKGMPRAPKDPLVYEDGWNEETRLEAWRGFVMETDGLPPILSAILAFDAWTRDPPLQHRSWLGALLTSALLRSRGKTQHHLMTFNEGLRAIAYERRRARDDTSRLIALLEAVRAAAETGLKAHDRWMLAHGNLTRKLTGRRSTSQLPALIELVMSRPLVSTGMVAQALGITQRGAQNLVAELGLKELTGRGRFRAWAVI